MTQRKPARMLKKLDIVSVIDGYVGLRDAESSSEIVVRYGMLHDLP